MADEHLADEQLQRYADGELSSSQATAASQHIAGCTRCAKAHSSLVQLHRMMGISAEYSAEGVDFDALYRRIERGTRTASEPAFVERLSVWWRELAEHRPQRLWIPAAGAMAAVAALVLLARAPQPPPRSMVAEQSAPQRSEPLPARAVPVQPQVQPAPQALASADSQVIELDCGKTCGGTIEEIALADGSSTTVAWIEDDQP